MTDERIRLNVTLDEVTHRELKSQAARDGVTLQDYTEAALMAAVKHMRTAPPRVKK